MNELRFISMAHILLKCDVIYRRKDAAFKHTHNIAIIKMTVQTNKFIGLDLKQLLLASSIMGFSSISNAALFDCVSEPGTCIGEGDTVIFKYAGTSSTMGLFGTVEVIGDSIVSFPTDFRAESLNGLSGVGGSVSVNDNGAVQVIAKDGYQINSYQYRRTR